jgi:hypothetical protein
MGSLVAALFFLRFWARTRDTFFLFFSAAFLIEGASRFVLAFHPAGEETEPLYYLPRLFAFSLIAIAVVLKNRPRSR